MNHLHKTEEICNPKCNTVYNFQESGLSKKELVSQMFRSKRSISYDNSRTKSYYMIILSLDYDKNKDGYISFEEFKQSFMQYV